MAAAAERGPANGAPPGSGQRSDADADPTDGAGPAHIALLTGVVTAVGPRHTWFDLGIGAAEAKRIRAHPEDLRGNVLPGRAVVVVVVERPGGSWFVRWADPNERIRLLRGDGSGR